MAIERACGEAADQGQAGAMGGNGSPRLLIVSPATGLAARAGEQARRSGCRVSQAEDGFAAVETVLQDTAIEAALLDMEALQPRAGAMLDTLRSARPRLRLCLICPAWLEPEARRLTADQPDADYLVEPVTAGDVRALFRSPSVPPDTLAAAAGPPPDQPTAEPVCLPGYEALLDRVFGPAEALLFAAARWASEALGGPNVELRWQTQSACWPQPGDGPGLSAGSLCPIAAGPVSPGLPGRGRALPCNAAASEQSLECPQLVSGLCEQLRAGDGRTIGRLLVAGDPGLGLPGARGRAQQVAKALASLLVMHQRFAALQQMAFTDHLSGAYNRRYVMHFLDRLIGRAERERFGITLMMFDIDDFKKYNDTYGHTVGDEIIAEIASLMRQTSREHDVVARIGGDEFAILFWDAGPPRQPGSQHPTEAVAFAARFRKLLASHTFQSLGPEARGTLTLSGGLAHYPADGRTSDELLARAADGLKTAKRSGKDRIYVVGQAPR